MVRWAGWRDDAWRETWVDGFCFRVWKKLDSVVFLQIIEREQSKAVAIFVQHGEMIEFQRYVFWPLQFLSPSTVYWYSGKCRAKQVSPCWRGPWRWRVALLISGIFFYLPLLKMLFWVVFWDFITIQPGPFPRVPRKTTFTSCFSAKVWCGLCPSQESKRSSPKSTTSSPRSVPSPADGEAAKRRSERREVLGFGGGCLVGFSWSFVDELVFLLVLCLDECG